MTIQQLDDVAARILELAAETPTKTISGGRLSELLKHQFPGFTLGDYGSRNLRAFIQDKLAGKLTEVGRRGTDIVYGLPEAVPPPEVRLQPTPAAPVTKDIERVFRSPNAPFELHVNRDSGEIRVFQKGAPIQDPWLRVRSATPDMLRQIAADFVSEVPIDYREQLKQTLLDSPTAWWPKFAAYLGEKLLYSQWLAFRRIRLRSALDTELEGLGVRRGREGERGSVTREEALEFSRATDLGPEDAQPADDLRETVVRIVRDLPLSELRNLRLPVGDLYDALKRRR